MYVDRSGIKKMPRGQLIFLPGAGNGAGETTRSNGIVAFGNSRKKREIQMIVQCLRTTMNATAPRPIKAISAP